MCCYTQLVLGDEMSEELTDKTVLEDFKKYLLTKEEYEKLSKDFIKKITPFLEKNKKIMFTLKGAPKTYGFSTTFGPYTGKQFALYISKNKEKKKKLEKIDLSEFYLKIEKTIFDKEGNRINWRTNRLVDINTKEVIQIEFIPLAFRGSFLVEVLNEYEIPFIDIDMLVRAAVEKVGKLFHSAIFSEGYSSTYPRPITDIENFDINELKKEIEEADFFIELQYIEKSLFLTVEEEIIEKFSESPLEKKIGLDLIKEGIPFLVQYNITKDFPYQKSKGKIISKPDFFILDPFNLIAIFCDSSKYHQRKRDQILKDRRIDRKLQKMGITVLRFTEEEINRNLEGCIEEIKEHYLGKDYALSSREVFMRKLNNIPIDKLSEWEERFVKSLRTRLSVGKDISLNEERILNKILEKFNTKTNCA